MSLTARLGVVSCATLLACGPAPADDDEWMLDTFAEFSDGAGQPFAYSGLGKLAFEPGGVGTYASVGACGRDVTVASFTWERRGPDAIAIVPEPGDEFVLASEAHEWRIALTHACTRLDLEEVALQQVRDGTIEDERTIYRGDLCLERVECSDGHDDTQCTDCRTVWCDEAPVPCGAD